MKFLVSLFFVAGSLALIGMLDNSLSQKAPKKEGQHLSSDKEKTHPLLSEEPIIKRPPFNDEGPGGGGGIIPGGPGTSGPNQRA